MVNPKYEKLAAEFAYMRDRPVGELARCLRERGVSPIGAIYVITRVFDLSLSEGKHILMCSPSWLDQEPGWQAFHDSLEMHLLDAIVGRDVEQVGRVHNTFRGNVMRSNGDLEIRFTDGSAMLVSTDEVLSSLKASGGRWVDPYGAEKSEDMVEFAAEYGRPKYFDMSAEEPYAGLIGQSVRTCATNSDRSGRGAVETLKMWIGGIRVTCRYHIDGLVVEAKPLSSLKRSTSNQPAMPESRGRWFSGGGVRPHEGT